MLKSFAFLVPTIALSTAWASAPGAPIDCSDFVAVQPGYSCVQLSNASQLGCAGSTGVPCVTGEDYAIDNESRFVTISNELLGHCGTSPNPYVRHKFMASTASGLIEIGHIDDRCKPPSVYKDLTGVFGFTMDFDPMSGALFVWATDQCQCTQPYPPGGVVGDCTTYCAGWPDPNNSRESRWVMKIVGFATTFDVLQSYQPTTSEIQFRVPYAPEGFAEADYFDTYWGPLRPGIDFSQAHSLHCGYPSTQPVTGDFESVPDTLPPPQVGNGYYYLTVSHHSGAARAGRKGVHGHLEGRDASILPACSVD